MADTTNAAVFKTEGHIRMMEQSTIDAVSVKCPDVTAADSGATGAADPHLLQQQRHDFTEKLRATMEEWGFAIVTDILNPEECTQMEEMFAKDLNSIVEIKTEEAGEAGAHGAADSKPPAFLEDPLKLWPTGNEHDPFSLGKFSVSNFGLVHGQFAWSIRRHPKVKASYDALYPGHEGKLCCGIDLLFFSTTPAEQVEDDATRSNGWWSHTDLNRHNKPSGDYSVYQGIVYIWPSGADRSTTVIYPKSHKEVYDHLMDSNEEFKTKQGHFCTHPEKDYEALSHKLRRVAMPAGSMLIFTSKTTHQGWANGIRLAAPVCWEPKALRDEAALERKKKAVLTGIPTSHWASLGITHPTASEPGDGGDGKVLLKHRAHLGCLTKDPASGQVVIRPEILECL